jgi:LEA14-like dessication related protein
MRVDTTNGRRARWLVPALALVLLGGCALVRPNLQVPRIAVIGVRVRRADFWQQQLVVRLRVTNPNAIRLPVAALSYALTVNGQRVADGHSAQSFTVPAHGSVEFDTEVTANMAGALLTVFGSGRQRLVHYRLRGEVELAHGLLRELPFDERGQFALH